MNETREQPGINTDRVVASVVRDLQERSHIGQEKYGTTLERKDISIRGWLQHLYEELLDAANYTKRLMMEMDREL